jgi:hypothetical protein
VLAREELLMKRLHIQLQPARSPELHLAEALKQLRSLVPGVLVTEGQEDGPYINVDFMTADLFGLWESVRKVLETVPGLNGAAIIVCEGERGWDDYLLLHHFDPQQKVDVLS